MKVNFTNLVVSTQQLSVLRLLYRCCFVNPIDFRFGPITDTFSTLIEYLIIKHCLGLCFLDQVRFEVV